MSSNREVRPCPICTVGESFFFHGSFAPCKDCRQDNRYILQTKGREEGIKIARKQHRAGEMAQKLIINLPAGESKHHVYGSDPR